MKSLDSKWNFYLLLSSFPLFFVHFCLSFFHVSIVDPPRPAKLRDFVAPLGIAGDDDSERLEVEAKLTAKKQQTIADYFLASDVEQARAEFDKQAESSKGGRVSFADGVAVLECWSLCA